MGAWPILAEAGTVLCGLVGPLCVATHKRRSKDAQCSRSCAASWQGPSEWPASSTCRWITSSQLRRPSVESLPASVCVDKQRCPPVRLHHTFRQAAMRAIRLAVAQSRHMTQPAQYAAKGSGLRAGLEEQQRGVGRFGLRQWSGLTGARARNKCRTTGAKLRGSPPQTLRLQRRNPHPGINPENTTTCEQ